MDNIAHNSAGQTDTFETNVGLKQEDRLTPLMLPVDTKGMLI